MGPLETDGWIEFTSWHTGLQGHRFSAEVGAGARISAVLYLDRRGRVVMPANNPYLPVRFETTRNTPASQTAAWLRASRALIDELEDRGVVNLIHFPPDLTDIRPFKWDGFRVTVRYTYVLDLPIDEARLSARSRKAVRRAVRTSGRIERTDDIDAVLYCLIHSEHRQGFTHGIDRRTLTTAMSLLGPDRLRMYLAFDEKNEPAATLVSLHEPGERAVGWLSGNAWSSLEDGIGLALQRFELDDLAAAGATGIDLAGANIESVAEHKAHWGAELVPTYSIRPYSLRSAVRYVADHIAADRRRRELATRRRQAGSRVPGTMTPGPVAPGQLRPASSSMAAPLEDDVTEGPHPRAAGGAA